MKAVKFTLSGKNAFFKKPEVNTYYYFTFGQIHKVALLGMFGAILGYDGYAQKKWTKIKKGQSIVKEYPEFYEKLQQEVAAFMDKGILLPFFRKYAGNAEVPEELADFLYAEYHTSPKAAVTIHYRLHQEFETEWINEPMRHILGGIFIRTFRLFAGEEIEYYISEQDENGEKTGEKHLLQREEAMDAWPETGVELLNRMNHAIQTEDSQAVNEMICSYERINEMTEQLFELK